MKTARGWRRVTGSTVISASYLPLRNNVSSVQRLSCVLLDAAVEPPPPPASQPADCWHRQNTGRGNVGAFFFFFSLWGFLFRSHILQHVGGTTPFLSLPSFSCFSPSLCPDVLIPNICTCWRCVFHRRRRLGSCVRRRGKKAAPRLSTAFTITIVSLVSLGPVPSAQAILFGRLFSTSYTIYTERTIQQEHISNIDVTRAASGCSILLFSG